MILYTENAEDNLKEETGRRSALPKRNYMLLFLYRDPQLTEEAGPAFFIIDFIISFFGGFIAHLGQEFLVEF